jgi:predicted transcriptional regulator
MESEFREKHEEEIERLKETISGEITMSPIASIAFKKWRNIFDVGQQKQAKEMGIKVSSLSSYENNRRNNPGMMFIQKFVNALIDIDLKGRSKVLKALIKAKQNIPLYIREFKKIPSKTKIIDLLELSNVNHKKITENIYGFTFIDSSALKIFDLDKYPLIHGKTNRRLLLFSKTSDITSIYFTLKLLKHFTGQLPLGVVIEDENPEKNLTKYETELKINVPLFLTKKPKEEILKLFRF